jgi:hypothetical protein
MSLKLVQTPGKMSPEDRAVFERDIRRFKSCHLDPHQEYDNFAEEWGLSGYPKAGTLEEKWLFLREKKGRTEKCAIENQLTHSLNEIRSCVQELVAAQNNGVESLQAALKDKKEIDFERVQRTLNIADKRYPEMRPKVAEVRHELSLLKLYQLDPKK